MSQHKPKILTRDEWRREQDLCHSPGCKTRTRMSVHEIIGGSDRSRTVMLAPFWLWLCIHHHNLLGSRPNQQQLVRQLAIKMWADPDNYDPKAVIKLWRPNGTADLVREVIADAAIEHAKIARECS